MKLIVIRPAGWALLVLGLALMPLRGAAQTSSVTGGVDTTRVTRTLGELRMTFMVTPPPTAPGDTATVIVRMENQGADSARVMMYPCYRDYDGVRYYWVAHEIVCLVGSDERWLAAGAMYTFNDTLQFVDVPGRYELEYLAVAYPRVVLRLPIVLRDTAKVR
jgi:hypothetical protein